MLIYYATLKIDLNLSVILYARIDVIVALLSIFYCDYKWYCTCGCEGTDRSGFCNMRSDICEIERSSA